MGQLLVVVFFLALFIAAPIKVAALFSGSLLLSTLVVQATTASISRVNVTLSDSFKAIVYSFLFTAVAVFTIYSFMIGAPREIFESPTAALAASVPLVLLQYGSFVLGFKVALGLTLAHSFIVAAASTLITTGAIWFISKIISHAS
jgi:hypothetical protein